MRNQAVFDPALRGGGVALATSVLPLMQSLNQPKYGRTPTDTRKRTYTHDIPLTHTHTYTHTHRHA